MGKFSIICIIVIFLATPAVKAQNTGTAGPSETHAGNKTINYENKTYTVSLGAIDNDGQGTVIVEILTLEKIEIPVKNGVMIAPIMMKIEAGGRTLIASDRISILDNSMSFNFSEKPDKVIVYGNDGNENAPTVTFTVTKDMIKTTAPPVTTAPVVQQPPPQPQPQSDVTFAQQAKPLSTGEKWRRWYLEAGLSIAVLSPKPSTGSSKDYPVKTMVFGGGAVNFGFYIHPNHRLSLDIGMGEIGEKTFYDGVINRDYFVSTVLLSYHYIFTPSDKCHFRLGASFGLLNLEATNSDDLSGDSLVDDDFAVFGIGGGFIWNFAKRWFLDTGYRIMPKLGEGIALDDFVIESPAHQFSATIGWRF